MQSNNDIVVEQPDKFYAKIRKDGDSLVVTIPKNYILYGGYADGDNVQVLLRKVKLE